jgi:MFS family permease
VAVTWATIHQPRPAVRAQRIDYAGIASLSLGLVLVLLALDQSSDWGWGDARVLGMLGLATVSFVVFAVVERRLGEDGLVPGDVIGNRGFAAACATVLCISAVFFTTVLYAPQLMEKILDYTALEAGVAMLPLLGVFAVVAFSSNHVSDRFGMRMVIVVGTALLALGPLLLSFFDTGSRYVDLLPGLIVTGIGVGLFYPTITTAAVTMLDASRASLAGGIVYMFQVAGGAIGLGLATSIFTTRSEDLVVGDATDLGLRASSDQVAVIHGILAGTESGRLAFNDFGTGVADKLLDVVSESFVAGIQLAFRVVGALAVVGLVVALLAVRPAKPAENGAPARGAT